MFDAVAIYAKLLLVLMIVLFFSATHYEAYEHGKASVQKQDAEALQKRQIENQRMVDEAEAKIKKAQETSNAQIIVITNLHNQLAGMQPIHFPHCPSAVPTTPQAGNSKDGSAGVLPDSMDKLFADIQARTSALIERCDRLNIDAIRLNGSL